MTRQKMRVEVWRGTDGWYWHIRWGGGRIAATSERYERKGTATAMAQKMATALNVLLVRVGD